MLNISRILAGLGLAAFIGLAANSSAADENTIKPQKMTKAEIAGEIFSSPEMVTVDNPEGPTYDVVSLLSSDEKFVTGMFQAGPSRYEITDPWGVEEFMYFLKGGVTLTSSDGTVQVINAGEAVTIPKEWTGVWETEGYTKIYVIYSETGDIE